MSAIHLVRKFGLPKSAISSDVRVMQVPPYNLGINDRVACVLTFSTCLSSFVSIPRDAGISPRGRSVQIGCANRLCSPPSTENFRSSKKTDRTGGWLTQFAAQGRRENGRCLSLSHSFSLCLSALTKPDPREGGAARFRNATVIIGYKVIPARLGTCIDARTLDAIPSSSWKRRKSSVFSLLFSFFFSLSV